MRSKPRTLTDSFFYAYNSPFGETKAISRKGIVRVGVTIGLFLCLLLTNTANAAIQDQQAIRAVIGEAGNQGRTGMLAVACAIRNRGTLNGVYGVNAKHVDREPQWVWDMAAAVWEESKTKDITNGADHWENIKAFGTPSWAKSMRKVFEYKDHAFYKSK